MLDLKPIDNNKPLISIITVVFNGLPYIEDAIKSVLRQSYSKIEYVVIDGGSTDGTLDIIEKYDDHIDYWVSEPDFGIYDAINKAIRQCNGELISILNADDYYAGNTIIEDVINYYSDDIDVYYGDVYIIDRDDEELLFTRHANIEKIKYGMYLNHPATFVRSYLYKDHGLYDTSYKIASDYDFLLRLYLKGYCFHFLDLVTVSMRDGGISTEQDILVKKETQDIRRQCLPLVAYYYTRIVQVSSSFIRFFSRR